MTIITTQSRVTYAGDNVTTVFPIPFEFFLNTDITAVKTSVSGAVITLTQNVDYTLSGTGVPGGGTATKTTALLTGETLAFFLNPPITQQSHYISNAPFPAATLENDIDRQTQISQRLSDLLTRSIRFPDSDINATSTLLPSAIARALTNLGFDAAGNVSLSQALAAGTLSQASIVAFLGADPIGRQTAAELALNITPTNYAFGTGSLYRYGAKGKAVRIGDAVINGAVLTSASNGFAGAVAGMIVVVPDGGASRVGGRPATLITTILSVQGANQITLSTPVIQPGTITMTGTLNTNTFVTSTSLNPITAGVGLARTWAITGTNIPANTTVTSTNPSTLAISQAATGSGVVTVTLTAPIEVCFGFDDSAAIAAALSLPYPITDVTDNFLTTQPLSVGYNLTTAKLGCNNISLPSALIIFAIANNTSHCVTAAGLDRGNLVYLDGARYLPFKAEFGELECCNTGLDGFSLQPSEYSVVRARINNPFRNALGEFFLTGGWQEGNLVDINCGRVGLHFHHKVNKSATYQTLGGYRIMGRAPGLNSVYLGINATTQPDQCGGAIRLYAGGGATADGGMSQNVWGAQAFCEMDGQRNIALSFGSDICNSAVTFVDASASYVIEGAPAAAFSNTYRSNTFSNMVIEDISQGADARGGYQYYAMANALVQSTTVSATSSGPWGQNYASQLLLAGADNEIRWSQRLSYPGILLLGDQVSGGAATKFFAAGYLGLPINTQATNYTLVASDAGKMIVNSAGTQTIPQNVFSPSNVVTIMALGGGVIIAPGTGVTLYWYNGTTLVTGNRTLANGAVATLIFQTANTVVATGPGLS